MEKNIYLAGAMEVYSGTDKAKVWRNEVKKLFKEYDYNFNIISPVDFYDYNSCNHKTDYEVFKFDLRLVAQSNILLINLNDIRKSIGTCVECYEAYKNNIPVIGFINEVFNESDLPDIIHPWIYCCCDRIEVGNESMKNAVRYIGEYYSC